MSMPRGYLQRVQDGWFCDLVEHYALGVLGIQFQDLVQMPRYGLSLAVLIACQIHHAGVLGGGLQLSYQFLLVVRNLVDRREAVLYIEAHAPFLQVAYVSFARHNLEVRSKESADGLRLVRRLYDH